MGLLSLFRIRTRSPKPSPWQEEHRRLAAAFSSVSAQVLTLGAEIGTIRMALNRHDNAITECRDLADRHDKALMRLEQLVGSQPAWPIGRMDRSIGTTVGGPALPVVEPGAYAPARRLDIDQFSEQQKRLLAVFFQNKGREMSYQDVAGALGKSAHTVKNQMNQIRNKADLFDCVTGPENRNFFKLKDDLKVETRLKVGRPIGRPGSTTGSDRSSAEHMAAPTEPIF